MFRYFSAPFPSLPPPLPPLPPSLWPAPAPRPWLTPSPRAPVVCAPLAAAAPGMFVSLSRWKSLCLWAESLPYLCTHVSCHMPIVCVRFGDKCCMHAPGRTKGDPCGCGAGDMGCTACGQCKRCGKKSGWCVNGVVTGAWVLHACCSCRCSAHVLLDVPCPCLHILRGLASSKGAAAPSAPAPAAKHKLVTSTCMVCVGCGNCTGFGSGCVRHKAGRPRGVPCGCGAGASDPSGSTPDGTGEHMHALRFSTFASSDSVLCCAMLCHLHGVLHPLALSGVSLVALPVCLLCECRQGWMLRVHAVRCLRWLTALVCARFLFPAPTLVASCMHSCLPPPSTISCAVLLPFISFFFVVTRLLLM